MPDATPDASAAKRPGIAGIPTILKGNLRFLLAGMFLSGTAMSFFGVLFNLYLKSSSVTESRIGYMLAASALGLLVGTLPAVAIVKRVDIRFVLGIPLLVFAAANVCRIFVVTPVMLTVMGFVGGLILSGQGTALFPYLDLHVAANHKAFVFGLFEGMGFGAGFLGSLLSGYTFDLLHLWFDPADSYRIALSISMVLLALATLPLMFLRAAGRERGGTRPGPVEQGRERPSAPDPLALFSSKAVWAVIAADVLVGAGAGLTIPYLNLYLKSRLGLPDGSIGLIFAFVNGGTFLAMLLSQFAARWLGIVWTVFLSQFLSVFMLFVLISGTRSALLVGAALVLRGGLMNMGYPLLRNLSMEITPRREQHTLTAVRSFGWNLAWMTSSFFAGGVIQKLGYDPTIKLTALLYLVSCVLLLVVFRSPRYRAFGRRGIFSFPPENEISRD